MHLFVDISAHGFGHLAIAAPVLNALAERLPNLRLTVRSGLPEARLRQRLRFPFVHVGAATDFGYAMVNALTVDRAASATAYRRAHADWAAKVEMEARSLLEFAPQYVLTNVSYLPLAGAARAGIPAAAFCSLNWADLFAHFFGNEPWAPPIHAQMLAAYRSARLFLRTTPGMPMAALPNLVPVGPIASRGQERDLALGQGLRAVLVAMGGIAHRLPVEQWPCLPGIVWLAPREWQVRRPDTVDLESFGLSFTDLLASVDAILTKPGYGTFTEAACNGTPVLYQRRDDWPEQDCLIDWLEANGCCRQVSGAILESGALEADLAALWSAPMPPPVEPDGAGQAAERLAADIKAACSRTS